MLAAKTDTTAGVDEQGQVDMRRYQEAKEAGFTHEEACVFSVAGIDVGELRRLVKAGCPPDLAARILL